MKSSVLALLIAVTLSGCTCNEKVDVSEFPDPIVYPVDTTAMKMRPKGLYEDRIYTTDFDSDGVSDTITPYLRKLIADFDLDEENEELFLETDVEVVNGTPMWKAENLWWAYIVDGYRDTTMLFAGRLSNARLELGIGVADTVAARPIYLLQRGERGLRSIRYLYFGPNEYSLKELVQTEITDWAR